MGEIPNYCRMVLSRVRSRQGIGWVSASEINVMPSSLNRLFLAGRLERYHDGKRWRYRDTGKEAV